MVVCPPAAEGRVYKPLLIESALVAGDFSDDNARARPGVQSCGLRGSGSRPPPPPDSGRVAKKKKIKNTK